MPVFSHDCITCPSSSANVPLQNSLNAVEARLINQGDVMIWYVNPFVLFFLLPLISRAVDVIPVSSQVKDV